MRDRVCILRITEIVLVKVMQVVKAIPLRLTYLCAILRKKQKRILDIFIAITTCSGMIVEIAYRSTLNSRGKHMEKKMIKTHSHLFPDIIKWGDWFLKPSVVICNCMYYYLQDSD
mmetsp:Transcript_22798/g.26988  ORF Transcript_22798/g.26988 Transcript_22798/m.26988 type:complete len:115 (+) Transcript_22798:186-530(+)